MYVGNKAINIITPTTYSKAGDIQATQRVVQLLDHRLTKSPPTQNQLNDGYRRETGRGPARRPRVYGFSLRPHTREGESRSYVTLIFQTGRARVTAVARSNYALYTEQGVTIDKTDAETIENWRPYKGTPLYHTSVDLS